MYVKNADLIKCMLNTSASILRKWSNSCIAPVKDVLINGGRSVRMLLKKLSLFILSSDIAKFC